MIIYEIICSPSSRVLHHVYNDANVPIHNNQHLL